MELQRRFHDCYKIDLIDEKIVLSFILNQKTGIIYSDEKFPVRMVDKTSLFSSVHSTDLYLNEDFVCNQYIANPMRNLVRLNPQKHEITFNDGRVVSFYDLPTKFSFKEHRISYEFYENKQLTGQITASRKWVYFKPGNHFDYTGEIRFNRDYSMIEFMLFLQFILQDCLYLDRKE